MERIGKKRGREERKETNKRKDSEFVRQICSGRGFKCVPDVPVNDRQTLNRQPVRVREEGG